VRSEELAVLPELVTPAQGVCDLQEVSIEPRKNKEIATIITFLIRII